MPSPTVLFFLLLVAESLADDLPAYHDVAAQAGVTRPNRFGSREKRLITETTGSGAALFDYDGDGHLDLYVVNGKSIEQAAAGLPGDPNPLYRNLGNGRFVEVTAQAGVGDTGWGGGAAVADYDNDGDPDLLVTNNGDNIFYRNNGDGTFADVTEAAGLGGAGWSTSAAFGDVNGDGFPDLYVCRYIDFRIELLEKLDPNYCRWKGLSVMCGPSGLPGAADALYLNQADGTFLDVTRAAGVFNPEGRGLGVTFFDFDDDGDQDIFAANDSTPNFLYQNDGRGHFTDVALLAGVAFSMHGKAQAGMGTDAGDFDEDGRGDLIVTNFQDDYNALRRNEGGLFTDVSDLGGVAASSWGKLSWGVKFLDANLDGFLDLFVASGHVYPQVDGAGIPDTYAQTNQLLLNVAEDGRRKFRDVSESAGPGLAIRKSSRGLAAGDFDNDGDWDLFVNEIDDFPTLLEDRASHRNRWLRLTLVGRQASRDAMGARIEYQVSGRRHFRLAGAYFSYLSSGDPRLLLGLGDATRAERLVVRWPGGSTLELGPVAAGEDVLLVEGVGRIR
jgi:hypothetical protein